MKIVNDLCVKVNGDGIHGLQRLRVRQKERVKYVEDFKLEDHH